MLWAGQSSLEASCLFLRSTVRRMEAAENIQGRVARQQRDLFIRCETVKGTSDLGVSWRNMRTDRLNYAAPKRRMGIRSLKKVGLMKTRFFQPLEKVVWWSGIWSTEGASQSRVKS